MGLLFGTAAFPAIITGPVPGPSPLARGRAAGSIRIVTRIAAAARRVTLQQALHQARSGTAFLGRGAHAPENF